LVVRENRNHIVKNEEPPKKGTYKKKLEK